MAAYAVLEALTVARRGPYRSRTYENRGGKGGVGVERHSRSLTSRQESVPSLPSSLSCLLVDPFDLGFALLRYLCVVVGEQIAWWGKGKKGEERVR
jgi:hypothetical protein